MQQVQRTIGEYKASECTELARQPNLDLNSNDFLPDSIANINFNFREQIRIELLMAL